MFDLGSQKHTTIHLTYLKTTFLSLKKCGFFTIYLIREHSIQRTSQHVYITSMTFFIPFHFLREFSKTIELQFFEPCELAGRTSGFVSSVMRAVTRNAGIWAFGQHNQVDNINRHSQRKFPQSMTHRNAYFVIHHVIGVLYICMSAQSPSISIIVLFYSLACANEFL